MIVPRRLRRFLPAALVLLLGFVLACATGAPRTRPYKMGPVDQGAGTLESVRHRLEGTWTLVLLEVYAQDGKPVQLKASGTLVYDEYGNLAVKGALADPAASGSGLKPTVLNYTGRTVIDAANSRMVLADISGNVPADKAPSAISADLARYYEFVGDQLKISVKDAQGRTTASLVWKKGQ
jgi:hypothetical protein